MSQSPEKGDITTETMGPGDGAYGVSFVARNTIFFTKILTAYRPVVNRQWTYR